MTIDQLADRILDLEEAKAKAFEKIMDILDDIQNDIQDLKNK